MADDQDETSGAGSDPLAVAAAALSVCESLLLALEEREVLDEPEIDGLLEDAERAHRSMAADGSQQGFHESVAEIVHQIRRGGNSVRMIKSQ